MGGILVHDARGREVVPGIADRIGGGLTGAQAYSGLTIVEGSGVIDTVGDEIRVQCDSAGTGRATLYFAFPEATAGLFLWRARVRVEDDTEDVRVCGGLVRDDATGSLATTLMSSTAGDTTYTDLGVVTGGVLESASGDITPSRYRKNASGTPSISTGSAVTQTRGVVLSICPVYVDESAETLTAGEFCFGALTPNSVALSGAYREFINDVEVIGGQVPARTLGVIQVEATGAGGGSDVRIEQVTAVMIED